MASASPVPCPGRRQELSLMLTGLQSDAGLKSTVPMTCITDSTGNDWITFWSYKKMGNGSFTDISKYQ